MKVLLFISDSVEAVPPLDSLRKVLPSVPSLSDIAELVRCAMALDAMLDPYWVSLLVFADDGRLQQFDMTMCRYTSEKSARGLYVWSQDNGWGRQAYYGFQPGDATVSAITGVTRVTDLSQLG